MNIKAWILWVGLGLVANAPAYAQGSFVNLDFEMAIQPLVPDANFEVPIATALPAWQGYIGSFPVDRVVYNTVTIGAAAVSLQGPGSSFAPFHGDYSVVLQASFPDGAISPSIAQVGQMPLTARSLIFYTYNVTIQVCFGGQGLTSYDLGPADTSPAYRKIGIDVSSLAGQTAELRFSAIRSGGNLDYIRFSSQPIPEPNAAALFLTVTACWFAWRRRRLWT